MRIQGVPFFDGGFTDETGIVGTLGTPDSSADVAVVITNGTAGAGVDELRKSATHRAIVAVTVTETPGLRLANAEAVATPNGLPVLQVGSEHQSTMTSLAATGQRARFVAAANRRPAQAINVVATVAGRRPDLPPLAVVTPRSGWWHCASERGGGLACWMEAIRAVTAARPLRPAIFVASSGHELGYLGFDAFLEERPSLATGAARWIHLGANIGAAGGQVRLHAPDDEAEAELASVLSESGVSVRQRVPRGTVPAGEARNIHLAGGRYVSLLGAGPGANRFFHMQEDRWPVAVDLDAVTRYATAVSKLAVTLVTQE